MRDDAVFDDPAADAIRSDSAADAIRSDSAADAILGDEERDGDDADLDLFRPEEIGAGFTTGSAGGDVSDEEERYFRLLQWASSQRRPRLLPTVALLTGVPDEPVDEGAAERYGPRQQVEGHFAEVDRMVRNDLALMWRIAREALRRPLTTGQAARIIGVSPPTVRRWAEYGILRGARGATRRERWSAPHVFWVAASLEAIREGEPRPQGAWWWRRLLAEDYEGTIRAQHQKWRNQARRQRLPWPPAPAWDVPSWWALMPEWERPRPSEERQDAVYTLPDALTENEWMD